MRKTDPLLFSSFSTFSSKQTRLLSFPTINTTLILKNAPDKFDQKWRRATRAEFQENSPLKSCKWLPSPPLDWDSGHRMSGRSEGGEKAPHYIQKMQIFTLMGIFSSFLTWSQTPGSQICGQADKLTALFFLCVRWHTDL